MPAALLVIDVQKAFDSADYWGRRNNPECEANVAALLAAWEGPRVYVRHDSDAANSRQSSRHVI
jgi:nicotinamidase-related amidase